MKLKSEKINGIKVFFIKKYKFINQNFPSSPYVIAMIKENERMKEIARGFTKKEALFNAKSNLKARPKKFINTIKGKGKYVKTELEDEFGRWNDNYSTKDGYFVIHKYKKHHIYKVI